MWKVNWSTWHERGTKKKSESLTGIEPMTSRTTGGCSIHWATRSHREQGLLTEFMCERKICPCIHQCYAWWRINSEVWQVIAWQRCTYIVVIWTVFGYKMIHINLPFTRWQKATNAEIVGAEKLINSALVCIKCLYRLCQGCVHHNVWKC